ncbi:MAG: PAS domain-containing protein [Planctomycetes bacterium]|nr:PAS domain-containing protein [Planctomycetota bacterium]
MNDADRTSSAARRGESRQPLVRALVLAFSAVVLIFAVYEVVERTWLGDADMQLLHGLHIARGIVASVVAAGLVGWRIVRTSPPLLAETPSEEELVRGTRLTEQERLANHARWLIVMRWIAVVVAVMLISITVRIAHLLPDNVWWPLISTVVVLAGFNVACTMSLRSGRAGVALLQVQIYGDLVLLTVLLHFSGGIENPLSLVMLFHVIIAGIVLSRLRCFAVAIAASVLFGVLALAESTHVLEHYTLEIFPHIEDQGELEHAAHKPLYVATRMGLHSAILLLTAYFVTTLADRLRQHERQLQVMADRALAERRLLERSLETTGAALRVVDRDPRSCWSNSRWNEWFGPESPGAAIVEQLDGEGSAAQQTFRDAQVRITELVLELREENSHGLKNSAAMRRWFQMTTAPLHDSQGKVAQVVELAQDITEQKRTQAQMIRAEQLAAIGELAGQVAHEVNNPIAIISAKTRLLLSDHRSEMSDETAAEIEKITDLSDRVARIAQGLLSYCRPSGAARMAMDIRHPIRQALALIEQRASQTGIDIDEDLEGSVPNIHANPQEMEQVFLNLLLNALDAMPQGGRLTLSARQEHKAADDTNSWIAVTVQDTGCGIPESQRELIFQPFFTTKEQGRGTGLGLSICHGLIQSHGGTIDVESHPGEGTRFTIRLPVHNPGEQPKASHG